MEQRKSEALGSPLQIAIAVAALVFVALCEQSPMELGDRIIAGILRVFGIG
jgi:hypothetical protein